MRQSHFFLKTSKTVATDETAASSKLLWQGGFIRESVAGRYYFLPLGQRVQRKIMDIVKQEMDAAGAQEMVAPILHPLELWKETNRTSTTGFELMKVKDRRDAEFALGGTAEEMFVDLIRKFELSYKDLPLHLYQFSPKFRDELRARGGLLRVREFIMKDGYSFHADETDFVVEYEKMKQVYSRIFKKLGLETAIVESDNGYIGGEYCHEFIVDSDIGESRYFATVGGEYAAHEDIAVVTKEPKNIDQELQSLQEVPAVRGNTMEDGVALHKLPLWQQIKDVVFVDDKNRFILAVIRGDYEVNEVKLRHTIGAVSLRPATDEEIRTELGSEPGFISPVGIKNNLRAGTDLLVIADDSLRTVRNSYGGANKKHTDLLNMNIDRDFSADIEADIALAKAGDFVKGTKHELLEKKGIEVGNVFQLGYHYTKLMQGAEFTDKDGEKKPYYMGCYGIGIGRTMAAIVETHHDDKGIIWPESVAPFAVHIVALYGKGSDQVTKHAEQVYQQLTRAGIEVLFDDRIDKSAGEKFADSDLIGIPIRVVVSEKTITQDAVEIKYRQSGESFILKPAELLEKLTP